MIYPVASLIVGRIVITKTEDGLTFQWEGGDVVGLTRELLRDADPQWCTYPKFPDEKGDRFTIGPYMLETISADDRTIHAKRIVIL